MPDPSDKPPVLTRLRERKLIQWALAYVAGAWALLEITSFAGESFGWPDALNQILLIVFGFGLVATLVLAWYHGEKGQQRVGGLELVILALVLAGAGTALTTVGGDRVAAEGPVVGGPSMEEIRERFEGDRPGLAVMPFESISEGPEDAAFVRGLHVEFLTRLQGISGLKVIDRQSVELLEGENGDVSAIAEALGVEYVLVGSAQRSGDRVSVNFRLIDAATRGQLWADSYTSSTEAQDLIDLQASVAQRLAAELAVALTEQERTRVGQRMTEDPEAYTLFLRANAARPELPPLEASRRRVELLEAAVELDPDFGLARMILVNTLAKQYGFLGDRSREIEEKVRAHLEVLVGRSSGFVPLAGAYYQYFVRRDYDLAYEAIRDLGDDLAVGAEGLQMSALIDRRIGRFESALSVGVQAASLEPLGPFEAENTETLRFLGRFAEAEEALRQRLERIPQDRQAQAYLAQYLAHRGEFDEARRIYRSPRGYFDVWSSFFERDWEATEDAIENGPPIWIVENHFHPASLWRGWLAAATGDQTAARAHFEEAVTELEAAVRAAPEDDRRHRALGLAYAGLGRAKEAVEHGAQAVELRPRESDFQSGTWALLELATIHAQLGDAERAVEILDDYFAHPHKRRADYVERDPRFDPIRTDPRFIDLIQGYWAGASDR